MIHLALPYTMNGFNKRYELPLFIVENGFGAIDDQYRIDYLKAHIEMMKEAVEFYGISLIEYRLEALLIWFLLELVR